MSSWDDEIDYWQKKAEAAQVDTRRLDWIDDWLEKVNWDQHATVRDAIDAAMNSHAPRD